MKKALVLDSHALTGAAPSGGICYTTPQILAEVKSSIDRAIVEARRESGELSVVEPDSAFLEEAEALAVATGDLSVLSRADLSLLALALQMDGEALLLTDDFALQNIALHRNIRVQTIRGRRIEDVIVWMRLCPVCGSRSEDPEVRTCVECGASLTRKAVSKRGRC